MDIKKIISDYIDQNSERLTAMSDDIWGYAEVGMREWKSSERLIEELKKEGFEVEVGVADMPTGFIGTFGSGHPVISFLGEFDALPGVSQKEGCNVKTQEDPQSYGHGCGHHLLGVGAMGAAFALKKYFEENNVPGTVKYFGCPGEENGSGKVFFARTGRFDDTDMCFTWHPGATNDVWTNGSLANYSIYFKFTGKTAHAAGAPHMGRSALDACELMNVGVNYLREHVIPEARMHYAYRDVGGIAPNVVQDHACVHYYVRAPKVALLMPIVERVKDIARGAALMTGTTVEMQTIKAVSDFVPNMEATKILQKAMEDIGAPQFDEEDYKVANYFAEALTEEDKANALRGYKRSHPDSQLPEGPLHNFITPFNVNMTPGSGTTDVGDASYCTPTAQCHMATQIMGTPGHNWLLTGQGKTTYAHKSMLNVAKAMALAGAYAAHDPEAIKRAREEFLTINGGKYECPLPMDVPPLK